MPTATPTPAPAPAPPAPAGSVLDDLFGTFWPARRVPARLSLLLGAVGVGVLAAVVLPFHDLGLGTLLVMLSTGAVMYAASRHRRDPFTLVCLLVCVLLALTTVVRDADWIVVLCVLAAGAVCLGGVTRGRTMLGFGLAGMAWPLAGLRGLPWLGRTVAVLTGLGNRAALLRTVAWSALGLLVFGGLFVSADALVAGWVDAVLPDLSLDGFVLRVFVAVAVGGMVLAAAYVALDPPRVDQAGGAPRPVTHRFEWLAPVLVVDAVFAAFLIAQAAVVFGGHAYLRRTTGLTYADYVHQGFGQLTVATALTLLVLWAAARKAPRATAGDRLWLRGSLTLLSLQTLVVVASALHRMDLYQQAYGFTRLRLLVDVFEGWLGLLVAAALVAGLVPRGGWLPRVALVTGAVALLGLAAVNPDAWIARHNLDRYAVTGRVDCSYLQGLSADAEPALADHPAGGRACAPPEAARSRSDWLEWNLGRSRAADVSPGAGS